MSVSEIDEFVDWLTDEAGETDYYNLTGWIYRKADEWKDNHVKE